MTTTFDPDDTTIPVYDDRPERIVRVVDPERQRRGRNSRKRGQHVELELSRMFEEHGFEVLRQSGPNRRDFAASKDGVAWSVESKSIMDRWPRPAEVNNAIIQAERQAGTRIPVVVFSMRVARQKAQWRVYTPDGWLDLVTWFASDQQPIRLGTAWL